MDWFEAFDHGKGEITLLPCNHWTMRNPFVGPNKSLWGSFLIKTASGPTIFVSGDSAYFKGFREIGREFSIDESLALIDSMKTTSDVYAPVSGEVLEINTELESRPELVNEDPFGEGWILKLKIKNPEELEGLMDAEQYEAYAAKEGESA